jgi:hypothetical protein
MPFSVRRLADLCAKSVNTVMGAPMEALRRDCRSWGVYRVGREIS